VFEQDPKSVDLNDPMETCPQCGGQLIYESSASNGENIFDRATPNESLGIDSLEVDEIDLTVNEDDLITGRESSVGDMIHEQAKDKVSQGVDSMSVFGIDIVLEESLGDWECVLSPRISGERKLFGYVDVIESFRFPPRKVNPASSNIVICAKCDEKTDDPAIVTNTEAFCSIGCYL
jgi:hypothetical protein